jgi:hypothetical protein
MFTVLLENLKSSGGRYKVNSVENTLETQIQGGLLEVRGKFPLETVQDYETSLLGAGDLLLDKINSGEGDLYSGISRSVGLVSFVRDDNRETKNRYYSIHGISEMQSIFIGRFTGLNLYPLILKYSQQEELVKTLHKCEDAYRIIRLLFCDETDIFLHEQIYGDLRCPVISASFDERPLYLLSVLFRLIKKHSLDLKELTVGICGIDVAGIRLSRLLKKIGCSRVLGYDHNEKSMLSFERQGGLATTVENICNNCDIVIICKDCFTESDIQRTRPGQFLVSLVGLAPEILHIIESRGVRDHVQCTSSDLLSIAPGLILGMIRGGIRSMSDGILVNCAKYISTTLKGTLTAGDIFGSMHQDISGYCESQGPGRSPVSTTGSSDAAR